MHIPDAPTNIPNVRTLRLAAIAVVFGLLGPVMLLVVLSIPSIIRLVEFPYIILTAMVSIFVSMVVFIFAIYFDLRNKKYNQKLSNYIAHPENETHQAKIRLLHLKAIVIMFAATIALVCGLMFIVFICWIYLSIWNSNSTI